MAQSGKLRTWNDDRGFGFIAPRDGGREVFVHISSFPRDGSRPTVGETLVYELGVGRDGKPQAVKVYRQALGNPSTYPRSRAAPRGSQAPRASTWSPARALVGALVIAVLGAVGYGAYNRHVSTSRMNAAEVAPQEAPEINAVSSNYQCDGRVYCSQMTSCAEAKFFLNNCPGTKMDGNNDGVPCEQQWCTASFSR